VLGTGSLALGAGVWAMHFIGMLAFAPCTDVDYDPATTILSSLPSIGASFVALALIAREAGAATRSSARTSAS
jgi:NO-binding membrane sensor protein with MHYT domain